LTLAYHRNLHAFPTRRSSDLIRDWKFPKGRSAEATEALWRRIVSTAGKVKFTGQPQLVTRMTGDAAELGSLDADLKFSALAVQRSEEHTSELQSRSDLVCRLL